ncbi:hypothetical protein KKA87_03660 [bacterium]|nr:hypothetical protein [bacterium]MBU1874501.1 hypothetical protein [bacterium]
MKNNLHKNILSNLLMYICLLFIAYSCKNIFNTSPPIKDSITLTTSEIEVNTIEDILSIKLLYILPDLKNPTLIYNYSDSSKDSIDASGFVRINCINSGAIEGIYLDYFKDDEYPRLVKIVRTEQIENYLVCLTEMVHHGKDIIIWEHKNDKYNLLSIYPSAIGVCLYCHPDFAYSNKDTFVIGTENEEEGAIYGSYRYFTLMDDSLYLFQEQIISGHAPTGPNSNPVEGATCKGFLDVYYDKNCNTTYDPVYYECVDQNGDVIYGEILGDSLGLYELFWHGVGDFLYKISPNNKRIKIGESIYYHAHSYIAVEYDSTWHWALREELNLP